MRKATFRAWNKIAKKMQYEISELPIEYLSRSDHEFIFLQYTGLTDKNGVEIYEGDVMRHDLFVDGDNYAVVKWLNEDAAYSFLGCTSEWGNHCEVVGNIYESPELLERKNAG